MAHQRLVGQIHSAERRTLPLALSWDCIVLQSPCPWIAREACTSPLPCQWCRSCAWQSLVSWGVLFLRSNGKAEDAAARLLEEEEMAQRIEERVRERVEAAMQSEDVLRQIEARLREERAALEQKAHPLPWNSALYSRRHLAPQI